MTQEDKPEHDSNSTSPNCENGNGMRNGSAGMNKQGSITQTIK